MRRLGCEPSNPKPRRQRGAWPLFYNGFRQLASRQVTEGQPATRLDMIYDLEGNMLAETDSIGVVQSEYVWLAGRTCAARMAKFSVRIASSQ
jgi:hypothetical protein